MKSFSILTCCLFFLANFLTGQSDMIEPILNSKIKLIPQVNQNQNEHTIFLKTDFGKSEILNPEALLKIQGLVILNVDLVFTTFKRSMTFNQKKLNRERLFSLKKNYPELFQNEMIDWNLVGQTSCKSFLENKKFFHGFKITFRPASTDTSIKEEIKYIDKVLSGGTTENFEVLEPESEVLLVEEIGDGMSVTYSFNHQIDDSTILKIFDRNPTWKKILVVCDFTGSMSPYTVQLLVWHKLNFEASRKRIDFFSFFNDGDHKLSHEKQIGKTGGIYHAKADSFEEIKKLAVHTMMKGNGGDTPENNIEALIQAIEKCEDCEDIILIADNFATPRDLSLLSKIERPIKIILCGTQGGFNPSYLNMAKKTNSSIHTIEEDILNLVNLNEGEEIIIGKNIYQIKNGNFIFVHKL